MTVSFEKLSELSKNSIAYKYLQRTILHYITIDKKFFKI